MKRKYVENSFRYCYGKGTPELHSKFTATLDEIL